MDLFTNSTVPILEQVVNFAQARHEVLAGNVANQDVPGYQVRDLSVSEFQSRLTEMIEARDRRSTGPLPGESESLSPGLDPTDRAMQRVKESMRDVLRHDGNDIGMETQVLEMSKNQSMHNMAIAILNQQFRLLNVAISERV